jgi:hypothetical protein
MPILLSGVRIDGFTVARDSAGDGPAGVKLEGKFSLLQPNGNVLAKQSINGYDGDVKLALSADLIKKIRAVSDQLKSEVETIMGINEDEEKEA